MMVCNGERRIHIEVEGAGELTVIALHGGPGFPADLFRPGLSMLAGEGFRVVYVDLPGSGPSTRPGALEADLAPFIEDIDAIRREVGAQSTVLLGHAWGAILACEYALLRPIEALILVNPLRILRAEGQDHEAQARRVEAVDPSLFPDFMEKLFPKLQAAQAGEGDWAGIDSDPWWARIMTTQWARDPSPAWHEALAAQTWGMQTYFVFKGAAFSDPTHPLNDYDLAERAAGIDVPVLVIASDNDANYVAPARIHAEPVAAALPHAVVVRMDDSGHLPFAEAPEAFAATAAGFLRAQPHATPVSRGAAE